MITPVRHRWLDEWQGAATPRLRRLVDEAVSLIAQYERETEARQRQRRPVDQTRHLMAIEVTVCNLAYAVLMPPETGRIALLTGNGTRGFTRYENPAFGRPFRDLLHALDAIGWLTLERGCRDGRVGTASSIAPTNTFFSRVHEAGISLTDFGRVEGEEVILFSRKVDTGANHQTRKEMVNYPETASTRAHRETMESLNAFQAKADIIFLDDGLGTVDLQNRVQRRYFLCDTDGIPDLSCGGRLYGGAWQNLKRNRRRHIRIEGEPVALLDYSAMAPRLAYASVGVAPPPGDIYALPGIDPIHRPAVKKALNTLLCDRHRRQRGWPEPGEGDPRLPRDWTVPRFLAALQERHPSLMPCIGTGMSPRLQNLESAILTEVMVEMKARNIPVLSIHDALLCPASRSSQVKEVMEEVALSTTSFHIPVSGQSLSAI
jgi:hypothetical protein